MSAVAIRPQSPGIVYASVAGCKADGATDNTATVQAILDDFGSAGRPLEFVFDGQGVAGPSSVRHDLQERP